MSWRGENLGAGKPESFQVIQAKDGEKIDRVMEQRGGTRRDKGEAWVYEVGELVPVLGGSFLNRTTCL